MEPIAPTEMVALCGHTWMARGIAKNYVFPGTERLDEQLELIIKHTDVTPNPDTVLEAAKEAKDIVKCIQMDVRSLQEEIKQIQVIAT